MKIVHVITGLRRGGAEGVLARLVSATRPEFDHVVVALRDEGHFGPLLRAAGVRVHALDISGKGSALFGFVRLAGIIHDESPTIVQTWLYHADVIGGLAARLAGVRRIIWGVRNTNVDAAAISRSTRLVVQLAARLSRFVPQLIVSNSVNSARVHCELGYASERFRIIANGYDVDLFRPDLGMREATRLQFGVTPDELLIGNVARWDRQKDHANLITALRLVAARHPRVRIMLVGTGMDDRNERLASLLASAGFSSRTILAGARDDIPAIMNALDLHVLSSLGEAFPNVVAEAMACGTPCVVTDVGDAAYITGDAGWVAPPRNPEALAKAISHALSALADDRQALAVRCRDRVVRSFALPRMIDMYRAVWRDLANEQIRR